MKKVFFLTVAFAGIMLSSCGHSGSVSLKTDTDTMSYAFGIETARNAFEFDSTMNVDAYCSAFKEYFNKKGRMTPEQASSFIGEYMTTGRARKNAAAGEKWFAEVAKKKDVQKSESGLYYIIENAGSEPKIQMGDTVSVNYTLKTSDGSELQTTAGRSPFKFTQSETATIKGFSEGILLLGNGGKAQLFIPWELGYGEQGMMQSPIGPKQALQFEIEVVDVKKPIAQ